MATTHTYDETTTVRTGPYPYVPALKTISWSAIFAGVAVTLTVQFLLSMLGAGVGLSTLDPLQSNGSPTAEAFGLGAGLWWVVSFFLSLVVGGIVAGEMAGLPARMDGALHGIVTWATATLLGVYMVGSLIGGTLAGVGHLASSAVSGAAAAAPDLFNKGKLEAANSNLSWETAERELQGLLAHAASQSGQAAANQDAANQSESADIYAKVKTLVDKGNNATPEDRQAVVDLIAEKTSISKEEAAQKLDAWEKSAKDAQVAINHTAEVAGDKAAVAADKTARVGAHLTLWGFLAFLLGAVAATLGGIAGSNCRANRTVVTTTVR
jgi:hypothetical protein